MVRVGIATSKKKCPIRVTSTVIRIEITNAFPTRPATNASCTRDALVINQRAIGRCLVFASVWPIGPAVPSTPAV